MEYKPKNEYIIVYIEEKSNAYSNFLKHKKRKFDNVDVIMNYLGFRSKHASTFFHFRASTQNQSL